MAATSLGKGSAEMFWKLSSRSMLASPGMVTVLPNIPSPPVSCSSTVGVAAAGAAAEGNEEPLPPPPLYDDGDDEAANSSSKSAGSGKS